MSGSCQIYEDLICRLPDGDLSAEDSAALRGHLASCADCRRMLRAMEAVTNDLYDPTEPPASLAAGVMERIRAEEDLPDLPSAKRIDATRRKKSARKRRWRGVGVVVGFAAVFALVIGGGGYLAARLLGVMDASNAAVEQSAAMEVPAAVNIPVPEPAEAESAAAGVMDSGVLFDAAGEDSAAARSEVMRPDYTWEHPAYVPEGREADFEALIADVGWPDGLPDAKWQVFCAVEYNGVIYEFLTDPEEQYLLWRDAAESAGHFHSPGTVARLWDILG